MVRSSRHTLVIARVAKESKDALDCVAPLAMTAKGVD